MTRNRWIMLAVAFSLVIGFDVWYFMGREEEPQQTFEEEFDEEGTRSELPTFVRTGLPDWQHPENWPLERRSAPLESSLSSRLMAQRSAAPVAAVPTMALRWPELGAILWSPDEPRVLLDGVVRTLGENHAGFVVADIAADSVFLTKGKASRFLRIDDVKPPKVEIPASNQGSAVAAAQQAEENAP